MGTSLIRIVIRFDMVCDRISVISIMRQSVDGLSFSIQQIDSINFTVHNENE